MTGKRDSITVIFAYIRSVPRGRMKILGQLLWDEESERKYSISVPGDMNREM